MLKNSLFVAVYPIMNIYDRALSNKIRLKYVFLSLRLFQ